MYLFGVEDLLIGVLCIKWVLIFFFGFLNFLGFFVWLDDGEVFRFLVLVLEINCVNFIF